MAQDIVVRVQLNGRWCMLNVRERHGLPHRDGLVRLDTQNKAYWGPLPCAACGEWITEGTTFLHYMEPGQVMGETTQGYHVECWPQEPIREAAPALLAACEYVREHEALSPTARELLDAAIAKARGEQR